MPERLLPKDSPAPRQLLQAYTQHHANRAELNAAVKAILADLDPGLLPLQQGLQHSSVALPSDIGFTLLEASASAETLIFRIGVFYQGIVAGCSCSDDPTPQDTVAEYCELEIRLHHKRSEASIHLL